VAIISGRDIDTLRRQLSLNCGLVLVGNHGLECLDSDCQRHFVAGIENFQADLDAVRNWISEEVPHTSGFVVEDKRLTIALHYRNANPSAATVIRTSLRKFLERECPKLQILAGNKVDEVIPRNIGGKGSAVRWLLDSNAESNPIPVYIGDDVTDEDAFFALRDDGVTVRVGALQRSWARYRVNGPADVVAALSDLVSALAK
jgi:trehalose-phosphatase